MEDDRIVDVVDRLAVVVDDDDLLYPVIELTALDEIAVVGVDYDEQVVALDGRYRCRRRDEEVTVGLRFHEVYEVRGEVLVPVDDNMYLLAEEIYRSRKTA